jgi:hypothetical protein
VIDHHGGPTRSEWWKEAACVSHDPEWWSDDLAMRPQAVRICLGCPVRSSCVADAVRVGESGVIRGAMYFTRSREERRLRIVDLTCPVWCPDGCHDEGSDLRKPLSRTSVDVRFVRRLHWGKDLKIW